MKFIHITKTSLFSKNLPCGFNAESLTNHAMPYDQHLQILKTRLGQAWFDGNKSIIDWRYAYSDGDTLVFFRC